MNFTDLFIRKPVLAMTISLLILVLGVRSLTSLAVRQYPKTQNAVVTISTTYYGADAQTVAGFITQPLESAIAQAQGIDYMSSTSVSGVSAITATLRLNYDANRALGFGDDLRRYDVAAQMLKHLGVKSIDLITNNPLKIEGLQAEGVVVRRRIPSSAHPNPHNIGYLRTKRERTGHLIDLAEQKTPA